LGSVPELGIKGLNPSETYIISCVNKVLPFRGGNLKYKLTTPDKLELGNRIITNDGPTVARAIEKLIKSPYKNIVVDD